MAVWKPDWSNRHPSHDTAGCGAGLDRLVELLAAAPNDKDLREQLGREMEGAGVSRHGGWVAEFKIRSAQPVPGREAEATEWLASRGLRTHVPPVVMARDIQRHVLTHGDDWPPAAVLECDVLWTARPA